MTEAPDATLIDVSDLAIGWDPKAVLEEHVSFQVPRGDVFVILGRSGCGKSTLLRHLIGLQKPLGGSISIKGVGAPHIEVGRPRFGVMFQGGALFGSLSVAENVALPLEQWTTLPPDAIDAVVRAKLKLVGLASAGNSSPSEISGGMRKRAAIARAMALEPNLIFLDEPSSGLDPVSAVELDELILTLNRTLGMTVVLVSHELESIFKIGKHCIMLDKDSKSIIASGNPIELRDTATNPSVAEFFHRRVPVEAAPAKPRPAP
jgi:phospholipid/cholesterol/gamma-HCH transport system ATP-binding protein